MSNWKNDKADAEPTPKPWALFEEQGRLVIRSVENGRLIAVIEGDDAEAHANGRILAASSYMQQALEGIVKLIGEQDLPDNGEFSGASTCNQARAAVMLATGRGI